MLLLIFIVLCIFFLWLDSGGQKLDICNYCILSLFPYLQQSIEEQQKSALM